MLATLVNAVHSRAARSRTEAELRRFHDAELREIGVTDEDIDRFLGRRR